MFGFLSARSSQMALAPARDDDIAQCKHACQFLLYIFVLDIALLILEGFIQIVLAAQVDDVEGLQKTVDIVSYCVVDYDAS